MCLLCAMHCSKSLCVLTHLILIAIYVEVVVIPRRYCGTERLGKTQVKRRGRIGIQTLAAWF